MYILIFYLNMFSMNGGNGLKYNCTVWYFKLIKTKANIIYYKNFAFLNRDPIIVVHKNHTSSVSSLGKPSWTDVVKTTTIRITYFFFKSKFSINGRDYIVRRFLF